eukprot:TRINITY_DN5991_c0_g1_i1.p1 TRINITY_DN5991_c0_g1~~TRINITY_DN5991_c0_g1_i1.p1  ORF type:complete len:305 (+),score=65.44 TRINITY_DN5991_c0_g1_i1:70-984(+)
MQSYSAQTRTPTRRSRSLALVVAGTTIVVLNRWLVEPAAPAQVPIALPGAGLAELVDSYSWLAGIGVVMICYLLCAMQKEVPHPERTPLAKRTDFERVLFVSTWFSVMSGIVNAVAFLEMGMTVSHHTGNTTHMGRLTGVDGMKFLRVIASFMAGAGCYGANHIDSEAPYARRFCPALLASAFAVLGAFFVKYLDGDVLVTVQLLAFSQGILNALTRKFTSLPLCCSHVTGYVTDAGSMLGEWVMLQSKGRDAGPMPREPVVFLLAIFGFAFGGFATSCLKAKVGVATLLIPAVGTAMSAVGAL